MESGKPVNMCGSSFSLQFDYDYDHDNDSDRSAPLCALRYAGKRNL